MNDLFNLILKNDVVTGMFSAGLLTAVLMYVRNIPGKLFELFLYHFTLKLTVFSTDDYFENVSLWLSKECLARNNRLITSWISSQEVTKLTPGIGNHLIKYDNKYFLVCRGIEESKTASFKVTERIEIYCFGRNRKIFVDLMKKLSDIQTISSQQVFVYGWNKDIYKLISNRDKRPIDTIFLADRQKEKLISAITTFYENKQWYSDRGLSWKLGVLLEGPPGTGKTSLILSLAGYFNANIYIINPQSVESDEELRNAFNVPSNSFVVIEDADACEVLNERYISRTKKSKGSDDKFRGITLSGFLNAVDGLASREGRVLFITSNFSNNLDKAILRPGRIDIVEYLGQADEYIARQMYNRFFTNNEYFDSFEKEILNNLPMSQANIQNTFLGWINNDK